MSFDSINKIRALFKRYFSARFGVKPLLNSVDDIEQWFESDLGKNILSLQQDKLDALMPEVFGYHLMQMSVLNNLPLSRQSPVSHHFSLGFNPRQIDSKTDEVSDNKNDKENFTIATSAISEFEHLPIDEESIDAAILHHVLDYSIDPHRLLRETARTIISNGYMIIIGFNPNSALMLKKQIGRCVKRSDHWRYHDLRKDRVVDWLRVLGFKPMLVQYGYHSLPFNASFSVKLDRILAQLLPPLGAFYIIVARKHVIPMTVIREPWKKRRALPAWVKGKTATHSKTKRDNDKL
ncbi:MAG: SAM-dependent methyltransferase [Oceanospirillaceae bacterium]|jgi:SAM-dependent methyltransferase